MRLKLIRPVEEYANQVMDYKREMLENNEVLHGCVGLERINDFGEWVDFKNRLKREYGSRYVPSEVFLAVRIEDNKLIGITDYRYPLTKFLYKNSGHIGYSIRPSERNKGYGSEMLKLLLPICKSFGEEKVLILCDSYNIASSKVIENNGGILEKEIAEGLTEEDYIDTCRYWIYL